MLEELVSSRIRRALLEHILLHPQDRFYLRGLAKTLNLSVTPLRRELKRLERSGMLTAVREGSILFYTVETTSQPFLKLRSVILPDAPTAVVSLPVAPRKRWAFAPVLVGVAAVLMLAGAVSLALASRQLASVSRTLVTRKAEVTVVMPPHSSSGVMRSSKWQLVPGGVGGGFGSAAPTSEAY